MTRKIDEFKDFHPKTRAEWREWLAEHHAAAKGVWFVYYKKASGKPRVTYDEAVEEALCYGWIDSLPRKMDDERSKLLFTPRKPKSVWSKPNKERVERMIEQGLMTDAGLKKIEAAKNDGSWNSLNESDNLVIPPDLAKGFTANKTAAENFDGFTKSAKSMILSWVNSAKREETRAARIKKTVAMAAKNKRANFDKEEEVKEMAESKKIALVTGANRGIGLETVRQLAAQGGVTVLLGARDETKGAEAAKTLQAEGLDVQFIHLDVGNAETHENARQFIEENFGKLDILINNAAIAIDEFKDGNLTPTSETPLEIYRKTFETNFFNVIALTQTLLPLVKKSDAGRIVNLSSLLGSLTMHSDPTSDFYHIKPPAYDISKTALNAYTVHLAYELRETPIKVNIAHPGYVATDMNNHQGPLAVEEGAKTSVALATLPDNGYTGKFIHLGEELPW